MLSDLPKETTDRSYNEVVGHIKAQTIIMKAIHDFLEEQEFAQILPHRLAGISQELFKSISSTSKNFKSDVNLNFELSSTVIYHQMILAGLDINQIYSVTTSENQRFNKASLDLEYSNMSFENAMVFLEKLMRRIKIDLETKINDDYLSSKYLVGSWNDTFPVISRHDIELEFGSEWPDEATNEYNSPFFVTCLSPEFYDKVDPERRGNHYLNYELYFPKNSQPIARGSTREYKYDELIDKMGSLGINRFKFRNYLLIVAEEQFRPSSGSSINLDNLIQAFSL